jgi:hypothetical protein
MTVGIDWPTIALTSGSMLAMGTLFIATVKGDARVLKQRLDTVDAQLEKLDALVINMAETRGQQNLADERLLAQGKRIDELHRKVDRWIEAKTDELLNRISRS